MSKKKEGCGVRAKKYKRVKNLSEKEFRRLVRVKQETFFEMLKILKNAEKEKKKLGGKPHALAIADRLLMCLEYLREYRIYFSAWLGLVPRPHSSGGKSNLGKISKRGNRLL